ncbi:sigma-70 family RNA polymerase sigma factor [Niabella sp.]|uniref:RNA polymerase sigma factor n=1 Tax=Niabella sp. TaxID=1962976 RepID=UPI00261776DE|nr:sigma-70 family RNA polymerase sigma factor [Niabella sp.]
MRNSDTLTGQKSSEHMFEELLTKYRNLAFSIAYKFVRDKYYAEDIVQEAFVKAFLHMAKLKNESAFSSWLCKIVYNESIKYLSVIKKNEILTKSININSNETTNEVFEKEQGEEVLLKLKNAMDILTEKEYLFVNLFYLLEKSIKEIHFITNYSEANIKVILHRARNKLSQYIKNH